MSSAPPRPPKPGQVKVVRALYRYTAQYVSDRNHRNQRSNINFKISRYCSLMNFHSKKENCCTFQTLSQAVPIQLVVMKKIGWKQGVEQELVSYLQIMVLIYISNSLVRNHSSLFNANSWNVETGTTEIWGCQVSYNCIARQLKNVTNSIVTFQTIFIY